MDNIPTNRSSESSSPSDTSDDNISKLDHVAEQQQQMANKIGPRFCDDVLLDALHFLRPTEHAHVRLASRRLQWLSDKACARYPPRVVPQLEVRGVYTSPTINGVPRAIAAVTRMIANFVRRIVIPCASGVPRVAGRRIVANSLRVYPDFGDSYSVDFPAVEPPNDIGRLSQLEISDFIGPELLQFLRVSARLMKGGCHMVFHDFDNFVRHHSADFIVSFFALFPSTNVIHLHRLHSLATLNLHIPDWFTHSLELHTKFLVWFLDRYPSTNGTIVLRRLSSLATPLFLDHPAMFDCTNLVVDCLDTFPLNALQGWLHLDEGQPLEQQKKRYLNIRFGSKVRVDHSIASVDNLVQQLKQRFLCTISCCSFIVEIILFGFGGPNIPELDPFVEDNERTGELLEFRRVHEQIYRLKRRRRESAGQEEGDREEEEADEMDEEMATIQMNKTLVYIGKVV